LTTIETGVWLRGGCVETLGATMAGWEYVIRKDERCYQQEHCGYAYRLLAPRQAHAVAFFGRAAGMT